jgi:hypothetical protein
MIVAGKAYQEGKGVVSSFQMKLFLCLPGKPFQQKYTSTTLGITYQKRNKKPLASHIESQTQ